MLNPMQQYASNIGSKRVDLFGGPAEGFEEDNGLLASSMTNQQLMDNGHQMMDETDQAIERSKKVVHVTVNVGTETAATLKAQTKQMSRIVNELDSIHFSIKKASQLVKEIGRQVATDRCIMALLFLIVVGVIAIIIVKTSYPRGGVSLFLVFGVLSVLWSLLDVLPWRVDVFFPDVVSEEDQTADVAALPKFDMPSYESKMIAKDVKSLAV
ncbi:novel plant SNARE 11 [Tanacetum coccineum]